jgi:hypothetical protein
LGWKKGQVSVIDGDQGIAGKFAAGRERFQKLVADVGLGKMGTIVGDVCGHSFGQRKNAAVVAAQPAYFATQRRQESQRPQRPAQRSFLCALAYFASLR